MLCWDCSACRFHVWDYFGFRFRVWDCFGCRFRVWANGDSYSGHFVLGERHGPGLMLYHDGTRYCHASVYVYMWRKGNAALALYVCVSVSVFVCVCVGMGHVCLCLCIWDDVSTHPYVSVCIRMYVSVVSVPVCTFRAEPLFDTICVALSLPTLQSWQLERCPST